MPKITVIKPHKYMAQKKIDVTQDIINWFKENVENFPIEELQKILMNPGVVVNDILDVYKKFCEEHSIDYTTTAMYQAEQEYRKQKEDEQTAKLLAKIRKKEALKKKNRVDTEEQIEIFNMAFRSAYQQKIVSNRVHDILYVHECLEPTPFKAFMEKFIADPRMFRFGKKTKDELIAFYHFYMDNFSDEAIAKLTPKEKLMRIATDRAIVLKPEEEQFVSDFLDAHGHLPMFYLITKFYENVDERHYQAGRDYLGICGTKKSFEQLQAELGVSRERTRDIIEHGIRTLWSRRSPVACWDAYRPLFTEPFLTAENTHFEQIKHEEHLLMDADCFLKVAGFGMPWTDVIDSVKFHDKRQWIVSIPGAEKFSFHKVFWQIRQEQVKKVRIQEVVFDLGKICRSKDYWWAWNEIVKPNPEAFPTILTVCKRVIKEMLDIEPKGNKIIFPPKKARK